MEKAPEVLEPFGFVVSSSTKVDYIIYSPGKMLPHANHASRSDYTDPLKKTQHRKSFGPHPLQFSPTPSDAWNISI